MKIWFSWVCMFWLIISMNACAKNGGIGKEGVYEALKSINQSHNPSIDQSDDEGMSYSEYELLRKENLESTTIESP